MQKSCFAQHQSAAAPAAATATATAVAQLLLALARPSCRDLIKQVRQCKTAAEERNVVAKESAALRQAFKEQDGTYRHRCGPQP